jgi:hypothetical protein
VGESLMMFQGCLFYVELNPSKRTYFGKNYKLFGSYSGFSVLFEIQTGQDMTVDRNKHASYQHQPRKFTAPSV